VQVSEVERRVVTLSLTLILAAFVATYLVASRLVGPLGALTRAAESVGAGDFRARLPIRANDDLSRLMTTFNGMVRDLATRDEELRQRQKDLEEDSDRLSTVLGGMIEGVVAVDEAQRVLFANKAAKSLLDFPGPDDVGRPIWEVVRNPTIQQVINDALAGRDRMTVEFELPRTHSAVAMLATRLPGKPCPGVVLVLHDVTELRRLENLRREFVSNVSHELKTPLTAIQAYTETLLSGALHEPEHSRQFVERIEEHADRLHALILDLLRLARIESSTDVFDVRAILLSNVVAYCLEEHQPLAQAKNISLTIEPSPEDLRVNADEEGLHTIVSNLIDNAVKYTPPEGRVVVRWRLENSVAVLEVSDTGPGIAPEHQVRIFERFYRVDKARSRELGGTGLGLSIVKHLTHVFGGTI
jgi:two-component system phosphate regulon sensor histidine kinase PhoR